LKTSVKKVSNYDDLKGLIDKNKVNVNAVNS